VITLNRHEPGEGGNIAVEAGDGRNFSLRLVSALALAPVAILIAYFGGWLFLAAYLVAAGIILGEWTALVAKTLDLRILAPGLVALVVAAVFAGRNAAGAATTAIAIGAIIAAGLATAWPRRYPAANPVVWGAAGVVYAGVALLAPVLLRNDPEFGFAAILFLFATVWATDISAYLAGRSIGGPLLWPSVSPKKTWSGAFGGLVGGVAAGTLVAYASVGTRPAIAGVLALLLSVVAQGGDLLESAVKRRFGAKDASGLIPGHGGMMDRLDGFLVAALAAVLIGLVRQGMAAPGRGLLAW
jgi:phosphatidate cytidylyltransferase